MQNNDQAADTWSDGRDGAEGRWQVAIRRVGALALAGFVAGCAEPADPTAGDPAARPVKIVTVAEEAGNARNRYPAIIGAAATAELSFAVGGTISELAVKDSDEVGKGDLIARLDSRDFESSLASARASFQNAEDEYQRAVRLSAQDAIAQTQLEQRKAQRDVAQAQLDSAEKALADTVLRAPFDGAVASVLVETQQTTSPGSVIATVIDVSSLEATINLPSDIVAQVPTQTDRSAVVRLEAAPGRDIEAQFSEANLIADATSQTYAVTFAFPSPENLMILPGMNATVVLSGAIGPDAAASAIAVPLAAVQSDSDGEYVWLVDEQSMTVSRQPIEIGDGIGAFASVRSGLARGQKIVGAGGAYLSEGLQVTPWTE